MPIVEQVELVIEGKMNPKDSAPHLTTQTEEPQGE
jgi:glycerol-3-phosphate dehydrogenase (NAD(P)+)